MADIEETRQFAWLLYCKDHFLPVFQLFDEVDKVVRQHKVRGGETNCDPGARNLVVLNFWPKILNFKRDRQRALDVLKKILDGLGYSVSQVDYGLYFFSNHEHNGLIIFEAEKV